LTLFYQPLIGQGIHHLDAEESRHCIKVLRKKQGDIIHLADGKGSFYEASIAKADQQQCDFKIINQTHEPKKPFYIHVAIAPTKNADRIEWFVEKAVEIGIDKITLVECEHSERVFLKPDRLRKIAVSAMKQSLKATLPEIQELTKFDKVILNATEPSRFIAYVDKNNPAHLKDSASKGQQYLILIGPEGDFSPAELQSAEAHLFTKVSLGISRLRTETAGLAACHILNLINETGIATNTSF
jgi:16S rRNA (uracil1498-N3)-methyltransferase